MQRPDHRAVVTNERFIPGFGEVSTGRLLERGARKCAARLVVHHFHQLSLWRRKRPRHPRASLPDVIEEVEFPPDPVEGEPLDVRHPEDRRAFAAPVGEDEALEPAR